MNDPTKAPRKMLTKSPDDVPEISGKPRKVIEHKPFYMANGCTVVRKWKEDFVDRAGSTAILTHVAYLDKKGRSHEAVILVQWTKLILATRDYKAEAEGK